MKNHVWRPLFVILAIVVGILVFRAFYVPDDFGTHDRGYTFGFHRLSNEGEWAALPAKYRGGGECGECHGDQAEAWQRAGHAVIPCENCHGAALDHPERPEKLTIDRSRAQCLRCHSRLFTPGSARHALPGIDPEQHNPGSDCVACHNPHNPSLEEM